MPTSNRLVFHHWSKRNSVTDRTAVYGPVCTVVWQGSVGDHRPYADQVGIGLPMRTAICHMSVEPLGLIGNLEADTFHSSRTSDGREIFDKQVRRKALTIATERG